MKLTSVSLKSDLGRLALGSLHGRTSSSGRGRGIGASGSGSGLTAIATGVAVAPGTGPTGRAEEAADEAEQG